MASKNIMLTTALLLSVAAFAQKDQLKAADKAVKKGNMQDAITALNEAEPLLANAKPEQKAQYYFLRRTIYMDAVDKKVDEFTNLTLAAKASTEVIAIEKASNNQEYTPEALKTIVKVKSLLLNSAIEDSKTQKFNDGAKKLYETYLLDKKDTINLYYTSSFQMNAKDYDGALKSLKELKDLNYTGKAKRFIATSAITNEEVSFATEAERDRMVKLKTHTNPRIEIIESKQGEIYKNIALILMQQKKTEEAKEFLKAAKLKNPKDESLALSEANLYLDTKDYVTYKKLVTELLEKNPNSADLLFNLGVISNNSKNREDAEKYYTKAIEANPKYINAYINLVALKLEAETPINTEMNKLGTSDKDNKRYDVLKAEKKKLYQSVIPILEKALAVDETNKDITNTLINVYAALDMNAEKKALKEKLKNNK